MSSPRVAAGASGASSKLVPNDEACTLIPPKQHKRSGSGINNPPHLFAENTMFLKHKRRYCRIEGCNSIVKSQGLCQRHGAKPKTCKVEGCTKQAQGNFDKMCKAHFKAMKRMTTPIPKVENKDVPPPAQGFSVYDSILPDSLNFVTDEHNNDTRKLPLIVHLKDGFDTLKPPAWHRNEERRARGMFPIDNPAAQLEGWERELVWMEILVLTGVPGASFRHLARAWGRDKGFHMVLAQFICERHGDVERKKRHGEKKGDAAKKKRRKTTTLKKTLPKMEDDSENNSGAAYNNNSNEDVGADVWDPSLYGDVDTNEALAAEIFDFTEKEFERVVSKYKQVPPPSDFSTGSSRNVSLSSNTTDIAAQAAMTALLGQGHVRSNSMHSNSNEEIIPTPVHVEVTPAAMGDHASTNHPNPIQSSAALAPLNVGQTYSQQLTPRDYATPQQPPPMQQQQHHYPTPQRSQQPPPPMQQQQHHYPTPQQQPQQQQQQPPPPMQQQQQHHYPTPQQQPQQQQPPPMQQQQMFQDPSQVQQASPPMQVPGHTYPPQQPQQQSAQGEATSHQITQQQQQPQLVGYNMHPRSTQAIQPHAQAQVQLQQQIEPQHVQQQIPTSISTPIQQTQQSGAQPAQSYSQQMTYALPSGEEQPQQHQRALAPVPTPAQATQFSQPPAPLIQQQQHQQQTPQQQPQQQQYQMNPPSYPQHNQGQLNPPAPPHHVDVSFEQQQLQSYETALPTNPLPQQTHTVPQQMAPMAASRHQQQQQQQHQLPLQYTQTSNVAVEAAPAELARVQQQPQQHPQHQLPFNPNEQHQQMHSQIQTQQSTSVSLPQVSGQQMVHPPYPPQHQQQQQHQQNPQQQEHLNQLMNHAPHDSEAQDPLDVHHEMNATREDPT